MSSSLHHDFIDFLTEATTPFHAVAANRSRLERAGFVLMAPAFVGPFSPGQGYFAVRNDTV